MVFRGGPVLTLDGKGRITVPVRWRDMLVATVQGQLVVAKNPDGCLSLYPLPVWEQFEASLLSLTTEDEAWRRFFVGSATEVEIDSASRGLIPVSYTHLDVYKRQFHLGAGRHFARVDEHRPAGVDLGQAAAGGPARLRSSQVEADGGR